MSSSEGDGSRRISVDLPVQLIERFDELKQQWGLRRRGAVLERLLEVVLYDDEEIESLGTDGNLGSVSSDSQLELTSEEVSSSLKEYNEHNAIVLIGNAQIEKDIKHDQIQEEEKSKEKIRVSNLKAGIDLPGFVRRKTNDLRKSLGKSIANENNDEPILYSVHEEDINTCVAAALNHWVSLYGSKPKENVVEAAMIWLARDIWPNLEGTLNCPFTWTAATNLMSKLCPSWNKVQPSFNRIIVLAGVLEDPFATRSLKERIPTLIRRFVNSFKRSQNVTSFQTLESTMTVHGALKLLGLPTKAGASLSLITVREAYKSKAIENHPDSGGSTETMRRINESYQLLKELYRK